MDNLITALEQAEAQIRLLDAEVERFRVERDALHAEVGRLRAALKRLIADYEDVPDPTDKDGQQVFADARSALEQKAL